MARDYDKEYRDYHGKPEQRKRRSGRNQARQLMIKKGANVAGKDVHHKDRNPTNNSSSNLSIMSKSKNRSMK
jgi:hypothetical protein